MSQYFQAGEHVLWNPSNAVAALFLRTAEAVGPEAGVPCGLGPMVDDECRIDVPVFAAFVDVLAVRHATTGHPVLQSLVRGFLVTSLVLAERAGVQVPGVDGDSELWTEVCRQAAAMPR